MLPNKKAFILHATILGTFVLVYTLRSIVFSVAAGKTTETFTPYELTGIGDLLVLGENTSEIVSFFMVIFLIMPLQKSKRGNRNALLKFAYGGYVKPEDLEQAIIAQNP